MASKKYVPSACRSLLLMRVRYSMVIKASIFPEWSRSLGALPVRTRLTTLSFNTDTQTLPEWYAYVPSKMDYSDIYSILALYVFFAVAFGRS